MYTLLHRTVSLLMIASIIFAPIRGYADVVMPDASGVGNGIVAGTGTIGAVVQDTVNGKAEQTITQTSNRMIANWKSFSIGSGGTVTFVQPSQSSIVLNRVTGGSPSEIYGALKANGRIFLVNPNGVLFGSGSHVDTQGLLASTLDISNADFLAGHYKFAGTGGSLVNAGQLSAPGGFVALLGSSVENSGVIVANLGTIALASGKAITLGLDSQSVISIVIDQATTANLDAKEAAVANLPGGSLKADGGRILLTAQTLEGVFTTAINNAGVIEAGSVALQDGVVELSANGDIKSSGTISAGQSVMIASDRNVLVDGGSISTAIKGSWVAYLGIKGKNVTLDSASLSAYSLAGNFNWAFIQISGSNSVRILHSNVLADASSTMAEAQVDIQGKYLTIDASKVTAEVLGNSNGSAKVFLGYDPNNYNIGGNVNTENISIINGSTVRAAIENGNSNAEAVIETDLTGTLDIDSSSFNAIAGASEAEGIASANINLNLFGNRGGDVVITDSTLTSKVIGEGYAGITVYNSENDGFFSELSSKDKGLLWKVVGGIVKRVAALIGGKGDDKGPILGSITITNSTIHAEANSTSGFYLGDVINSDSDEEDIGAAVIGMMSLGPITLTKNSSVLAKELNHPAVVGFLSGAAISVDGTSKVEATASGSDSLAFAAMLAMGSEEDGNSIKVDGSVLANAGDGLAGVGIFGLGDVYAPGVVSASGKADGVQLIGYLLGDFKMPAITLGVPGNFGSAALLGSLYGNITLGHVSGDLVGIAALGAGEGSASIYGTINGLVSGNLLALIARNDIGTSVVPINTDVDVVAGGSWKEGSVYLKEANDIALGLVIPVSMSLGKIKKSLEKNILDFGIGISLWARDGIVHVESQGDMVVNSVIAPNGGVYLKTFNGSIYAGTGWNPSVCDEEGCNLVENFFSLLSYMGMDVSKNFYKVMNSVFYLLRMENPFVQYTEEESQYYLLPAMIGFQNESGALLNDGPNVIAGGYSYFSAPRGTIGVGYLTDKDPNISGQIQGIVRPGNTAVTGLTPSVDLDLSQGVPPGLVYYDDADTGVGFPLDGSTVANSGPQQVWPVPPVVSPILDNVNPLRVHIDVLPDSKPAIPAGFTPLLSGLTLQIGTLIPPPPNPEPPVDTGVSQLVNPLLRNFRAYYEILHNFRLVSVEPMTPTTFFAYHPLSKADTSAFDGISLDANAYEYIDGTLNYRRDFNPYFEAGKE